MRLGCKAFYFTLIFALVTFLFSCASSPKSQKKMGKVIDAGDDFMMVAYSPSDRNLTAPDEEVTDATTGDNGATADVATSEEAQNTGDNPNSQSNALNSSNAETADTTSANTPSQTQNQDNAITQKESEDAKDTSLSGDLNNGAQISQGDSDKIDNENNLFDAQAGGEAGFQKDATASAEDNLAAGSQADGEHEAQSDDAIDESFIDTPISEMAFEEDYGDEDDDDFSSADEAVIAAKGEEVDEALSEAALDPLQAALTDGEKVDDEEGEEGSALPDIDDEVFDDEALDDAQTARELGSEGEDFAQDTESEAPEYIGPKFSREVSAKRNDLIEVQYPGSGWAYQENIDMSGEADIQNLNFLYKGRKLGGKAQTFILQATREGEYLLHFYKMDNVTGDYIDDWLKVTVSGVGNLAGGETVHAPQYEEVEPVRHKVTQALPQKSEDFFTDTDNVQDLWSGGSIADEKAENDYESSSPSSLYALDIDEPLVYEGNEPVVEVPAHDEVISDGVDLALLENAARKNDAPKKPSTRKSENTAKSKSPAINNSNGNSPKSNSNNFSRTAKGGVPPEVASKSDAQAEKVLPDTNTSKVAYDDSVDFANGSALDMEELLANAKELYNDKKYSEAFSEVKKFLMFATERVDEGLFLKAQLLEARNTTFQDIKAAIKNYEMVTQRFPQSTLWTAAQKRAVYLKRFYVKIY